MSLLMNFTQAYACESIASGSAQVSVKQNYKRWKTNCSMQVLYFVQQSFINKKSVQQKPIIDYNTGLIVIFMYLHKNVADVLVDEESESYFFSFHYLARSFCLGLVFKEEGGD